MHHVFQRNSEWISSQDLTGSHCWILDLVTPASKRPKEPYKTWEMQTFGKCRTMHHSAQSFYNNFTTHPKYSYIKAISLSTPRWNQNWSSLTMFNMVSPCFALLSRFVGLVWYRKGGRYSICVINDQLQFASAPRCRAPFLCMARLWNDPAVDSQMDPNDPNEIWSLRMLFLLCKILS